MNIDPNIDPIGGELQGCEGSFTGRAVGQPPHCCWLYQWIQWLVQETNLKLQESIDTQVHGLILVLQYRTLSTPWSSRKEKDRTCDVISIHQHIHQWHGSIGICFFCPGHRPCRPDWEALRSIGAYRRTQGTHPSHYCLFLTVLMMIVLTVFQLIQIEALPQQTCLCSTPWQDEKLHKRVDELTGKCEATFQSVQLNICLLLYAYWANVILGGWLRVSSGVRHRRKARGHGAGRAR